MVRRGEFREDLYFRLNVVQIVVPPLRERKADISPLARHFLSQFATLYDEPVKSLAADTLRALEEYAWPGNVRELANTMERVHILAPGPLVTVADLPEEILPTSARGGPFELQGGGIPTLEYAEQLLISRALDASGGNKTRAAEILQIDRHRLHRKIRVYGL
jgi:DNA-binding NtrC family response regulator